MVYCYHPVRQIISIITTKSEERSLIMDYEALLKRDDYRPFFYYAVGEKFSHTMRICIELTETVDGVLLQKALHDSIRRYPYFSVKLVVDGNEYVNAYNDRPIVVKQGREPVTLATEEANYHILALCYKDNSIFCDVSHSVTDARGFYPFVELLIANYFKYSKGILPEQEAFDEAVLEEEIGDPYRNVDFDQADQPLYRRNTNEYYHLQDGTLAGKGQRTMHRIVIDESGMMKYASSHDGSPGVVIAALLSKVIWENDPNVVLPVKIGVGCDHRPALNTKSYRTLSNIHEIAYDARLKAKSLEELCTLGRGMIILQNDPDNILYRIKQSELGKSQLAKIPTVEMKQAIISSKTSIDRSTASVSYMGRVSLGAASPYVTGLYTYVDSVPENGFVVELLALNGMFYLAVFQGFDDNKYLNGILQFLDSEKIPYTYLGKEEVIVPKMRLIQ